MLQKQKNQYSPVVSFVLLGISLVFTLLISIFIYFQVSTLYKISLQNQVKAIATTGALNFTQQELDLIKGPESIGSKVFNSVTKKLQNIRLNNQHLKFAYIYRKTNVKNILEYVADADSIRPDIPIDLNMDGQIDEEDALVRPGDKYDASEFSDWIDIAFSKPYVGEELETSQWGETLDATAPILGKGNQSKYVIGVDVDVSEFLRHERFALIPFFAFVLIVIVLQIILTIELVKIWGNRVQFLKDLDRQKDELLGLVSHQLATPISGLRWNLEMITDGDLGPLTEKQKEEMRTMEGVVGNLSDLVGMILDVSRIQLGKMKVDKAEIDLQQFYKEMYDVLLPKSQERKQTFTLNIDQALKTGFIDKRLSHMTIENLMSNAVKYTPEGGTITVDVTIRNNMMHCVVADTGMGIPKKDQEKIFGKLYRASNVAAVDGNGFGLFVAKGAIEAQGGKIWFESEEGKGTKFYVDLPIVQSSLESAKADNGK